MIKKLLLAILLALPLSGMAQKFGVVDLESIFASMPESAAMQTQLQQTSSRYEEEFSKLQEEVNKLYTEYQAIANDPNTPESIKERRVQEIQERAGKVEQFRNTAEQDIARLQQQLMAPIQQRLMDAVKAVGTEESFTFIFPNEPSLLLYTGGTVENVTPKVRVKLGLPATPPPTPAATTPAATATSTPAAATTPATTTPAAN